jgi:hypothetical protein
MDTKAVEVWYNRWKDAVAQNDLEARLESGLQLTYAVGADVQETSHQLQGMWLLATVEGGQDD